MGLPHWRVPESPKATSLPPKDNAQSRSAIRRQRTVRESNVRHTEEAGRRPFWTMAGRPDPGNMEFMLARESSRRHMPRDLDRRERQLEIVAREAAIRQETSPRGAPARIRHRQRLAGNASRDPEDLRRIRRERIAELEDRLSTYEQQVYPPARAGAIQDGAQSTIYRVLNRGDPERQMFPGEHLPRRLSSAPSPPFQDTPPRRYAMASQDLSREGNLLIGLTVEQRRRLRAASGLDGLGDRDRSLSPENDNAWDTLLTTLTPDPQPPSASASFTSAAVSTREPTTASTSMTSLDDVNPEPACDDPMEELWGITSETETDEEPDEMDERVNSILREQLRAAGAHEISSSSSPRTRDVHVDSSTSQERRSVLNARESLGGMQRIVQGLASREEIPDEWWAEVGLRRTLPREEVQVR